MSDNEPKTQAGRDFLKKPPSWIAPGVHQRNTLRYRFFRDLILAIEAEAAAPYEERLRILIQAVEDHMADPTNQSEPAAAEPPAHALILEGYDREKGYRFRDPNAERAAQPPPKDK